MIGGISSIGSAAFPVSWNFVFVWLNGLSEASQVCKIPLFVQDASRRDYDFEMVKVAAAT